MQAEIIGIKLDLQRVNINPQKAKDKQTCIINGNGQNLTIKTPKSAASVISIKILLLFTLQGCCSEIQAPIVSAQISGNMISFSPLSSASHTIEIAINIPNKYLSVLIVFNNLAFIVFDFKKLIYISRIKMYKKRAFQRLFFWWTIFITSRTI